MRKAAKKTVHRVRDKKCCCTEIRVWLRGETIERVEFKDGCDGNHRGLEALLKGMAAREVAARLAGVDCTGRGTSCPDQLAKALGAAMEEKVKVKSKK
jgi:uncharacterized protein (TIGR03905 family)